MHVFAELKLNKPTYEQIKNFELYIYYRYV